MSPRQHWGVTAFNLLGLPSLGLVLAVWLLLSLTGCADMSLSEADVEYLRAQRDHLLISADDQLLPEIAREISLDSGDALAYVLHKLYGDPLNPDVIERFEAAAQAVTAGE